MEDDADAVVFARVLSLFDQVRADPSEARMRAEQQRLCGKPRVCGPLETRDVRRSVCVFMTDNLSADSSRTVLPGGTVRCALRGSRALDGVQCRRRRAKSWVCPQPTKFPSSASLRTLPELPAHLRTYEADTRLLKSLSGLGELVGTGLSRCLRQGEHENDRAACYSG